jgi:hypothetical protein
MKAEKFGEDLRKVLGVKDGKQESEGGAGERVAEVQRQVLFVGQGGWSCWGVICRRRRRRWGRGVRRECRRGRCRFVRGRGPRGVGL